MGNAFVVLPIPVGNGIGAAVDVSALGGAKTILVDGSFDAIVTVQASADGVNFIPVKSFQNGGFLNETIAAMLMRVQVQNLRAGTPTVAVGAPDYGAAAVSLDVPSSDGVGVAADIDQMGRVGTVYCHGDFSGSAGIEVSDDGSNFSPLTSFQNTGLFTALITARFIRVKRSGIGFNTSVPTIVFCGAGESSGDAIAPEFQPLSVETIYARLTGSDVTGNGTLASPYRTFQRAVRDIPQIVPPVVMYNVDITGIGLELLPPEYTLPPIQTAQWFEVDFSSAYFRFICPVNISADPQLVAAIPPADAVVDAPDILSDVADPNTGLRTITLNVARASWAADALKGKFLVGAGGGFDTSVIISSTATVIEISTTSSPTTPFQIMEPSAVLQGDTPSGAAILHGSLSVIDSPASIALRGLGFLEPVGGGGFYPGLEVSGLAQTLYCQLCDVDSFDSESGSASRLETCWLHATSYGVSIRTNFIGLQGGLYSDSVFTQFAQMFSFFARRQAFVGVGLEINTDRTGAAPASVNGGTLFNSLVRGAPAGVAALRFHGTNLLVQNSNFEANLSTDVIVFDQGQGLLDLVSVQGPAAVNPGVVGVGVRAYDGAYVRVDAATDVAGAGGDVKAGDLAAAAYGALPQYDITAVGAGGATGTGSRVYI